MQRLALCVLAAALIANDEPPADPETSPKTSDTDQTSEFVGRYDGSSFETAMGMDILADGTWGWGLSVGALDMRARGTWEQTGETITLTSTPKPIAPRFSFSGLESPEDKTQSAPFVRVVWAESGNQLQHADVRLLCANGKTFGGQVRLDGYPSATIRDYEDPLPADRDPRQSCDSPDQVVFKLHSHDIRSERFDLAELGWKKGMTARFAFHRNDLGVADFTGVTGYLEHGKIKLLGAEWPLEMRKIPPRDPSPKQP